MKKVESYSALLKSRGVSLETLGLKEIALDHLDTLNAIEALASANVPILGGDVYFERHGRVEVGLSNWYTDRQDGEPRDIFANRSWDTSRKFVSTFPNLSDGRVLFVLVVEED